MNAETTLDRVMIALGIKSKEAEPVEVKLEQIKTMDGQATFDAEVFEVGSPIFVVAPDGNIPAPQGEYQMEDGTVISVDDKGYIAEIATVEEETAPEEEVAMQNAPMKEQTGKPVAENVPSEMAKPKKMTETVSKVMEYSSEIAEFKKELDSMKLKLSALSEENQELKNRLATEAPRTYHSPEKTATKSIAFKIGDQRVETTTDRVFKQLFS